MTKHQTEIADAIALPTGTDLVIYVTPHHLHYFAEGVECPVVKWCTLTKTWVNKEGYYSLCDVANAHTVVWQSEVLRKQRDYEKNHLRRVLTSTKPEEVGTKHDSGKVRYSLLPKGVIEKVLSILEFGANKYSKDNWQQVPNARDRYYDAAMRHIQAWYYGETKDPETGESHLAHALCCLMFLLWLDNK